jgi:hypothetical protein
MFYILSSQANKQKLRRLHVHVAVSMGLPSTSADWNKKDLDEWCRKHVPNYHSGKKIKHVPDWHSGKKIIDANGHHLVTTASNKDDNMTSYANEDGKQLYINPQRRMKSDNTYARDDLDLASAATQWQQQRPHPHQQSLQTGTSKSSSFKTIY